MIDLEVLVEVARRASACAAMGAATTAKATAEISLRTFMVFSSLSKWVSGFGAFSGPASADSARAVSSRHLGGRLPAAHSNRL